MIATRFAVATHILLLLATGHCGHATSIRIAKSVNTNPVVVRRITGQLTRAGLIRVRRGPGGAELARPPACITLEDVWCAVNETQHRPLLPLHNRPDPSCPVGRHVRGVLGTAFGAAENALRASLASTSLDQLLHGMMDVAA